MMLSRALGLATVTLLIGCCAVGQVQAQENLDAGKSPSQIFATTCSACHKSPRGLLKTVSPGSLPGFLREHYTTGPDMAGVLASYLISNGATDTRYGEKPKRGKEARSVGRPAASSEQPGFFSRLFHPGAAGPNGTEPQRETARPGHAASGAKEPGRRVRKRHPAEASREPAEGSKDEATGKIAPGEAATEPGKPGSSKETGKADSGAAESKKPEGDQPAAASSPGPSVAAEPAKQTSETAPAAKPATAAGTNGTK